MPYCRYAALNGLPGSDTLLSYLLLRGTLLVAAKVFFSGLPALIVTQSSRAQQVAVYAVCLPLLGVQSFVSASRDSHKGWGCQGAREHVGPMFGDCSTTHFACTSALRL